MFHKLIMASLVFGLTASFGSISVHELPSLPQPIAGQFVGAVDNAVVVAGGSWWPAAPSSGAKKAWDSRILALQPDSSQWKEIARLPQPLGYGGSASLKEGLVLAGGENGHEFSHQVSFLVRRKHAYRLLDWPSLPEPLANFSMAAVGRRIYAFGGQSGPNDAASAQLWSLTVDADGNPSRAWQEEPPIPSGGRILASAVGCDGKFYVVGGATLVKTKSGSLVRRYLREVWSFDLTDGWQRLPDLPSPVLGAPAVCMNSALLVIGGDDGHMAGVVLKPGEQHPGFSKVILRYDISGKAWTTAGELPAGLVTTGAAITNGGEVVIPGGEDRPGSRSGTVLQLSISK